MADKKTFTIEINGLEEAYDNVIRLQDALKAIDDIELNINSNISDTLGDIEQNSSQVASSIEDTNRAIESLNNTIDANTESLLSNTSESNQNVSANESILGSIAQRKESIEQLTQAYEQLSNTDRDGDVGKNITEKLREQEVALAAVTLQINDYNQETQNIIAVNNEAEGSISQQEILIAQLKEQYNKMSEAERELATGTELSEKIRQQEVSLAATTLAINNYNRETQNTIALNNEAEDSIRQQEILISQLEEQYNKMSVTERELASGTALAQKIKELKIDLASASLEISNYNREAELSIAIYNEAEGSIRQQAAILNKLQEEYEKLSEAERKSSKGTELITKIRDLKKEIEDTTRLIDSELATFGFLGSMLDLIGEGFSTSSKMAEELSTTLSSATEVLKTFDIESEALNKMLENTTSVTKTLNDIQAIHTSLVSKDSIVMKGATLVKQLYTKATKGSSVALKGFKLALASTGIGAILVLVGALVTNFDNIKKTVGDAIGGFERFDKIMTKIEPIIAGVGNVILQFLLVPIKQAINAISGIIDVISIFKEKGLSGFGDAINSIKDTASKSAEITKNSYNIIGNYNKAFNDKITEQEKEKNRKILTEDARVKNEFIQNAEAKSGADWKFTEEGKKAYMSYFETLAELYKEDKEAYSQLMRDKDKYNFEFEKANKPKITGPKRDYKKELEDYQNALNSLKNATAEYQIEAQEKAIEHKRKMIEIESSSEVSESRKLAIENLKKSLAEKLAAQKKASDEEIKSIKNKQEAQEKAAAAEIALQETKLENEKQIAKAEMDAIDEVINKRQQAVDDLKQVHAVEYKILDDKLKKEFADTTQNYEKLKEKYIGHTAKLLELNIAFEEQKTALTAKHEAIRAKLRNEQEDEETGVQNKVKESEAAAFLLQIDLDENFLKKKQEVTKSIEKDNVERNGLGLIDIKATKENYKEAIKADEDYKKELEKNKDAKLKFLDEMIKASEGDTELQQYYLSLKTALLAAYEKETAVIDKRLIENKKNEGNAVVSFYDDLHDKIKEKWDKINSIMTTVGTALSEGLKSQLEEIKAKQEEVTKQYDEAVEKHKASQEKLKSLEEEAKSATGGRAMVVQEQIARQMDANNELAKQEKDLARQKEKLEKDAAKKEKQMKKIELAQGLVTGIANIAMGITKALAKGPIIGPIMAAAIGAMGAIQTATIVRQMSKLEDGGLLNGKRHTHGGMRIEGTNIEVEGDEYVINRISTSKNLGLIDYINKNRKELTQTDINSYFAHNGSYDNRQDLSVSGKKMYEQGGLLANLEVVDSVNAPENDKILDAISKINFKPVVSVVDITAAQDNLSEVKDIAGA